MSGERQAVVPQPESPNRRAPPRMCAGLIKGLMEKVRQHSDGTPQLLTIPLCTLRPVQSKRPASSVADFSSSRMTVKPSFEVDNYFGQDGLGDMDDDDDDDDDGWADDDDVDEEDIKRIEREAQAKQREERRRALDAERERKRLEK